MSRGITIADLVQQVYYSIYKVRLDVGPGVEGNYHSKSDKFQEVVMEANIVLQELQKEQDWNWLRDRWEMGIAHNPPHGIQEFTLPDDVYKICCNFGDAVRLHHGRFVEEISWTEARTGNKLNTRMFDEWGRIDMPDERILAFQVGNDITFTRPWTRPEEGCLLETDVIRYLEPLHICDDSCEDSCKLAYEQKVLTEVPDPWYVIAKTARRRAEGDPSAQDRIESLTNDETKMLSAMRENDSQHSIPDMWDSFGLGFVGVL